MDQLYFKYWIILMLRENLELILGTPSKNFMIPVFLYKRLKSIIYLETFYFLMKKKTHIF